MSWRQKTKAAVEKFGGRIEDDSVGDSRCYQIIAPRGFYWAGCGLHMMCNAYHHGPWKEAIENDWKTVYESVMHGLEKCEDLTCEMCNEESE